MKTAELEGAALDYWVASAIGWKVQIGADGRIYPIFDLFNPFQPSTSWSQGGPIIEREVIATFPADGGEQWGAQVGKHSEHWIDTTIFDCDAQGHTPLIAAMRAFVASKFGDEVPDIKETA